MLPLKNAPLPSTPKAVSEPGGGPSERSINYALALLFLINTANLLDRQIVNILVEPIKRDLQLTDWQLGVMTGFAFALFYTVLGIPLARYADRPRTDRAKLISVCLAAWSGMTALCGLAGGFLQLVAARIGVAIGEAGCSPASHALIADTAPKERRASALAIYSAGVPAGKLLGLLVGGVIAEMLGWRAAFFVVGLPGVVLAVVCWFTLRDSRLATTNAAVRESVSAVMRVLVRLNTFWIASLAAGFVAFLSYGQTAFLGSFMIRVHGLSVGEAGVLLGLTLGIGGAVGVWLGGRVADFGVRRDVRAYMWLPAAAACLGSILFAASVLSSMLTLAVVLLGVSIALTSSWYGPMFATVQSIVVPSRRATAASIHLFIINIVGIGGGPVAFGLLSDVLNVGFTASGLEIGGLGPAQGLRYALVLGSSAGLIAAVLFLLAARTIRQDLIEPSTMCVDPR